MRKAAIVLLILIGIFSFSGCAAKTAETPGNTSNDKGNQNLAGNDGTRGNFARPDLTGEVSVIKGRKVTLKVIETPQFNGNRNGNGNGNGNGTVSGNETANGSGGNANGNTGDSTTQKKPVTVQPQGDNGQPKQNIKMEVKYTGKTEVITVPENVEIERMIRTDTGRKTEIVKISEVKVGDIFQITYSDKEKKTISAISIRAQNNN